MTGARVFGTFEILGRGEDGADRTLRVRVPGPAHAVFDGHFAGDPLLPAWVQLALVQELAGPDVEGLGGVRFRAAVRPDEELEVRIKGDRFEVRAASGVAAAGRLERGHD